MGRNSKNSRLSCQDEEQFTAFLGKLSSTRRPQLSVVVITHAIPGVVPFLNAVSSAADIAYVIPKPSSIVSKELARVEKDFRVAGVSRHEVGTLTSEILEHLPPHHRLAILDMGGYFSGGHARHFEAELGDRFCGVVEDTENGIRRYEREEITFPVFSVARSPLKLSEDHVIGEWIVHSADTLVRRYGKNLRGRRSTVIGYGRVGSSIAQHLKSRGCDVVVFDSSAPRLLLAEAHGFKTASRGKAIRSADFIFSATGNKALQNADLEVLGNETIVFAATSGDDEFSFNRRDLNFSRSIDQHESEVWTTNDGGSNVQLANGGQAVNFMFPGGFAEYILPVQAELIMALQMLSETRRPAVGFHEVTNDQRERIAAAWIEEFRWQDGSGK